MQNWLVWSFLFVAGSSAFAQQGVQFQDNVQNSKPDARLEFLKGTRLVDREHCDDPILGKQSQVFIHLDTADLSDGATSIVEIDSGQYSGRLYMKGSPTNRAAPFYPAYTDIAEQHWGAILESASTLSVVQTSKTSQGALHTYYFTLSTNAQGGLTIVRRFYSAGSVDFSYQCQLVKKD